MKIKDTRIATGGLMRCCTGTIRQYTQDHAEEAVPATDMIIDCAYEKPGNARLQLQPDGIWQWNAAQWLNKEPHPLDDPLRENG